MKMVKSLLLGSAAGLVAVAGAQAADLPVKAKPVEYVKICSLYGVGFYYIPGTDMCIKIGGWVRAEYGWGVNGSSTQTYGANPYLNNRATNNSWWRVRGYITADARNQTEYGTVRGYIAVGISTDDLGAGEQQSFNANRAFIQWAGFTFGRAASFFDFYAGAAVSYFGFYPQSDTGDGGKDVLAYTAQFGNGFSASIAAELPRRTQIIGATVAAAIVVSGTRLPSSAASASSQVAAARQVLVTAASRLRTSSPICASTRLGVRLRSPLLRTRSMPLYYINTRQRPLGYPRRQWSPRRQVGLGGQRRPQAECADDRRRRLLPDPGQLYPGCIEVHLPEPERQPVPPEQSDRWRCHERHVGWGLWRHTGSLGLQPTSI